MRAVCTLSGDGGVYLLHYRDTSEKYKLPHCSRLFFSLLFFALIAYVRVRDSEVYLSFRKLKWKKSHPNIGDWPICTRLLWRPPFWISIYRICDEVCLWRLTVPIHVCNRRVSPEEIREFIRQKKCQRWRLQMNFSAQPMCAPYAHTFKHDLFISAHFARFNFSIEW